MHADETALNRVSERIIGCAFTVLNTLGAGFLEKVYENALAHELRARPALLVERAVGLLESMNVRVLGPEEVRDRLRLVRRV